MLVRPLLIFFIAIIPALVRGQDHGLIFNGQEHPMDKRTGVNFTASKPLAVSGNLNIAFDFRLIPGQRDYYGYIFRLLNESGFNIDLLYDQKKFGNKNIKLILDQEISNIGLMLDTAQLFNQWTNVSFSMNPRRGQIRVTIGDRHFSDTLKKKNALPAFWFVMGANDLPNYRSNDVPSMIVKDVKINIDDRAAYFWPLHDADGAVIYDELSHKKAIVRNPVWITSSPNEWHEEFRSASAGAAVTAFDCEGGVIYVLSSDRLQAYHILTKRIRSVIYASPHVIKDGAGLLFNPIDRKLYYYFLDNQYITKIDPVSGAWEKGDLDYPRLTVNWQTAKAFSVQDSAAYFFGGYGQLSYKNDVVRYHFPTKSWTVYKSKGITPRYLSAMAIENDSIFVYGGYGSETGSQLISPAYHFELYGAKLGELDFHKIQTVKKKRMDFVPASSMVYIPESNDFYALIFSNYIQHTKLNLIRWDRQNETPDALASDIPFTFIDIRSHADLFLNGNKTKLIALKQYKNENDSTQIAAYTLAFPPGLPPEAGSTSAMYWIVIGLLGMVVGSYALAKSRKSNKAAPVSQSSVPTAPEDNIRTATKIPYPTQVSLFGPFEVQSAGESLTRQFTPLLKELFLLILIYTIRENGISSKQIDEILWHSKTQKDAKNNRSVNIAKLRNLLDGIGSLAVVMDGGNWRMLIKDDVYIDLNAYTHLIANRSLPDSAPKLAHFVTKEIKGGLLEHTDFDWLDRFKSEIHNQLVDLLTEILSDPAQGLDIKENAIDRLFSLDPLNETALFAKCKLLKEQGKHSLALKRYEQFAAEYRLIYNIDFHLSFDQLIKSSSIPNA